MPTGGHHRHRNRQCRHDQSRYGKQDAIVMDFGYDKLNGKISGDVDFASVSKKHRSSRPCRSGTAGVRGGFGKYNHVDEMIYFCAVYLVRIGRVACFCVARRDQALSQARSAGLAL